MVKVYRENDDGRILIAVCANMIDASRIYETDRQNHMGSFYELCDIINEKEDQHVTGETNNCLC